jgi:hypothetical protein
MEKKVGPTDETTVNLSCIILGFVVIILAIGAGSYGQGLTSSYPYPATPSGISFVLLAMAFLILLCGSFLVARGLSYPLHALPSDQSLLRGTTRRHAPLVSRLFELASWALVTGVGLQFMGLLVGIPALQGAMCMDGPCTVSDVSPALPLALYLSGVVAICLGGVLLLIRTVLGRLARGGPAAAGAP